MRQRIERRLSRSRPPADPVSAALERLPAGIAEAWFDRPLVPAAVLMPLLERDDGLYLLLTQRTEHLVDHPGQISFPGGRAEPADSGPLQTALRETEEEIGLRAETVEIAGYLDPLAVVTGFAVAPVVGFVGPNPRFEPDPFEVDALLEVPLAFFLDEANHIEADRTINGVSMRFSEYHYGKWRIWGATAKIIRDLTDLITMPA